MSPIGSWRVLAASVAVSALPLALLPRCANASPSPNFEGDRRVIRYAVERACVVQHVAELVPRTCQLRPSLANVRSLRDSLLLDVALATLRMAPEGRRTMLAYAILVLSKEGDDIGLATSLVRCPPTRKCSEVELTYSSAFAAFGQLAQNDGISVDDALARSLAQSGAAQAASTILPRPLVRPRFSDLDTAGKVELLGYLMTRASDAIARAGTSSSAMSTSVPAWNEVARAFRVSEDTSPLVLAEVLAGRSIDPSLLGLFSLASSSDRTDVRAAALALGYRLPPWTDRWIVDGGISSFQLSPSLQDLGGNLALGYASDALGGSGRASASNYLLTGAGLVERRRFDAELEGWGFVGLGAHARLEVRGFVGAGANQVRLRNAGTGSLAASEQEQTGTARTGTMVGLRWYPSSRFVLTQALGLALQLERYEALRVNSFAAATPANTTWGFRGSSRSRVQVAMIPDVLAVRLKLDASVYRTQLGSTETLYFSGLVSRAASSSRSTALDVEVRIALDFEVLRVPLVGLVPSIHGGLDAFLLDTEAGVASSGVPVVGVGLRRESM